MAKSGPPGGDAPVALIGRLRGTLGAKLVAFIAGASDTSTIAQWADATTGAAPEPAVLARLQVAETVAVVLLERDEPAVAQAWFMGMNPALGDVSPARLLRDGAVEDVGPEVLAAAHASVSA